MKIILLLLCLFAATTTSFSQAFDGVYAIGNTRFTVRTLSEQDRNDHLFNIVYFKGDKNGTMASLSENPKFEFVFDEFEGDIYRGTFYFTKAWKGKPLQGFYVRAKDKKKIKVKFLRE